ncbi:Lrp/AsnC family transcriptional regulator [Thermoplasma sp.]|uniref:Lrp/AsnC family transcriptional regulator n=1 Tax=Thermoplasma sp. TaxID=1973142 RepID=UPI0012740F21|nr:Lrp/AsnC family transcriptional regulator [Thermoplasma sp.]KAA8921931.1 MAG: Lrp/AsnC family transcriptional regulator [Thermoplasma sp.]
MKDFKIDRLDQEILALLEEDCTLTYSDIAKDLNANMWTVRDRIELLKKRGVITGCKAILDYSKMGYGCEAMIFLVINPSRMNEFISFLRSETRVKEVTVMTGDERIMINIVDRACSDIKEFIQQKLNSFEIEVKEFNIVLERPIR